MGVSRMTPTAKSSSARIAALAAAALSAAFAADAAAQGSVASDRAALEALYDATDGANWTNRTNWKTSVPLDQWYGVTTDAAGRVTALNLSTNGLAGSLPVALGSLPHLKWLRLPWNDLTGPIPSALGSLLNLEALILNTNDLTGPIPRALGNLTSLRRLDLHDNALTGPVPGDLRSLVNLWRLSLGGNDLTGPIPAWLDSLVNLTELYLADNALTGPIPSALGSLVNLVRLDLGGSALTGSIPSALGSLVNLRYLSIGGTDLTGPIPRALGNLVSLRTLRLTDSAFTGPIPDELGSLVNLEAMGLHGNALTGPVPPWFGNLGRLRRLYLSQNGLTGSIPTLLGRLVNLRELSLRGNGLMGSIPDELGSLVTLETLDLESNELTGTIPSALGSLVNLERLSLGDNYLTGSIPGELGNLESLESLTLYKNDLTGSIPGELGNLESLESLTLRENPLTGPLPLQLTRLSRLRWLDIRWTGACAPGDAELQAWLATIRFQGVMCNRAPQPVATIPAQTLTESGPSGSVSVGAYFNDPDGDPLTYGATSSHAASVAAFVSGGTVWLVPGAAGTATVTVTARDAAGLSAAQTVAVTVDASAGPQSEREVLEALYDASGGAGWTDSTNWKTAAPLGEWHGVATGAAGQVTSLDLKDNGLTGSIPSALGSLANLESLDLSYNELIGAIPVGLGGLVNLESMRLVGAGLTGPIPVELGSLKNLELLDLSHNELIGAIPGALGALANLEWLDLGGNDLAGPIPAALAMLVNLELLSLFLDRDDSAGPIPDALGSLANLEELHLRGRGLIGPVPAWMGDLSALRSLSLSWTGLTGPLPDALGNLANLEGLRLSGTWGVSGRLPSGLRRPRLERLETDLTQTCAPVAWRDWLETIRFRGRLCDGGTDVTIDVAVVYTPAARERTGGTAAIEADIDLSIALTNHAYAASGVGHRVALVARSEVPYVETGNTIVDVDRLRNPSDGHLDGIHALRDRVGADLVHLIVGRASVCGRAFVQDAFGLSHVDCGYATFAHEFGHNMGLLHDRYQVHHYEGGLRLYPAYGYVNQRIFAGGAPRSSRWYTIMAYPAQCDDASTTNCFRLLRFSNPRQSYSGDPLGTPFGTGNSGVTGPADAAAVLNHMGPAVALWRDRPADANQPPVAVGTLRDRELTRHGTLDVDLTAAFVDPDGDALRYGVSSSTPDVVTVLASGARVTLTAVGAGTASILVTATDPGGLSATQLFAVTVTVPANLSPEPVGALAPLTLEVDEAPVAVDVATAFRDPDGDPLIYWAGSSAPGVATVAVSGSRVTVMPVAAGEATVTVTAADAGGLSALQTFAVTVSPPANRPPEPVGVLAPVTLGVDDAAVTVDVAAGFRDPDGDGLTYGATSSAPGIASVVVFGSAVIITPVAEGAGRVTVTATDTGGSNGTATQTFAVTVSPPANRPPEPVGVLAPVTLGVDDAAVTVDVAAGFRDPDGDGLTYGATSSAPGIVSVVVFGSAVVVTPVSEGTSSVTVTATDVDGSNTAATQTFLVTVTAPANRPPEPVGVLAPLTVAVDEASVTVEVSGAFRDPDGDALTYAATSSAPGVASVSMSGSAVTVTPVAPGKSTVTVTATDTGGSDTSATQTFRVTVQRPFTDHPIVAGVTPIKAIHFTELRSRINAVRTAMGEVPWAWGYPVLTAGVTPVMGQHLDEMRVVVELTYEASGRRAPRWTDPPPLKGTAIRAVHLMELRAAVMALE